MSGISDKALKVNYAENKFRYNDGNELQNKEFSDGAGLEWYDANHRMYDPQIGKFGQLDEFGEVSTNLSPYSFSVNNPISHNDPLGLDTMTRKTNLDPVYVTAYHTTQNLINTYWHYINNNIPFAHMQDKGVRNWLTAYDDQQQWLNKLHIQQRIEEQIALEIALVIVPIGPELEVGATALRLYKVRRGLTVLRGVGRAYGEAFVKNVSAEVLKNRGQLSGVDWLDVATSTIASKYGLGVRVSVELFNATTDVTTQSGASSIFLPGQFHKDGGTVFLDAVFGYLKFTGEAIGNGTGASEQSKTILNTMFDQTQKTISDAATPSQK